jgi:copper transport protein
MKRLVALVGVLFGLALLLAGPASAHATVVTSTPADGSRLKAAPKSVTVVFDESVGIGRVGYLHVTDQNGKRVDARAAYHPGGDGSKVSDDLRAGLPDGTYTASFRIVSADSHPVAGTIRFVVGNGPLVRGSVSATSSSDPGVTELFGIARWISYGGVALLAGAWLVLTVWPAGRDDRPARRTIWLGWGAAVVGGLLELLMQGPYSSGAGVGRLFSGTLIDDTLHSEYGQLHSLRLVLLGVVAVLLARSLQPDARPARWEWLGGGALFLGVVWTFSRSGHAATTSPAWFSVVDDMLHVLAMATWLGGLVLLLRGVLPRREPAELRAVLPVFSRVALVAIGVLVASGTYSALRGVGTVGALFHTSYGLLVVLKVVLLLGIVAVAAGARRIVQRRTVAYAMTSAAALADEDVEEDVQVERLRRSVFVEALAAFVVLALTGLLVAEPRGKEALAASYRKPVSVSTALGGGRTAEVTADPGVHGPVNVTVAVSGGAAPKTITATATQHGKQIGPLPIKLTREGSGVYDGSVSLPVAGAWEIDLVVTTSEFDATTADVTVHIH